MKSQDNKHILSFKKDKLRDMEEISGHLEGWIGEMLGKGDKTQHNGQFILTNKRVCFYRKGILGEVFETIPLEKLSSVETLSVMGYRVLRCHTSNDELSFKTFESKVLFDKIYENLEKLRNTGLGIQSAPEQQKSVVEELLKLSEMKEKGMLSNEEFEAIKKKLIY